MLGERLTRSVEANAVLRGEALIAALYRRDPCYTIRSRIAERVLPSARDRASL